MVPVSCPPCPASMTMRPIFKPRARDKDCWPSRGVSGMEGGPISSAWSCADFRLRGDLVFPEAGLAVGGGAAALLPAPAGDRDTDCTTRSVGAVCPWRTAPLQTWTPSSWPRSLDLFHDGAGAFANRTG